MEQSVPLSFDALDKLGRIRLSQHFFMRDFLYSETAIKHGLINSPSDPALAEEAGSRTLTKAGMPNHRGDHSRLYRKLSAQS